MSKAVLIAIRPDWCALIASGKKTIEIRKTRPKLETPFKCYIYCTKSGPLILAKPSQRFGNGLIIGEFICDKISRYTPAGFRRDRISYKSFNGLTFTNEINYSAIGLSEIELAEYGSGKTLFGWHISKLKIYGQPKELRVFHWTNMECIAHGADGVPRCEKGKPCSACSVTRAPQSWCYVEESTIPGG